MSYEGPPWYVRDPTTGEIDHTAIPERLQTHPELQRRGITLDDTLVPGVVYRTTLFAEIRYVVKVLGRDSQELAIYERLLKLDPASPNHILPCEISQNGHPILIMPQLRNLSSAFGPEDFTLSEILGIFFQLVEGVEFLHRLHIAHMDISWSNALYACNADARPHRRVETGKVYIIDFSTSRQLRLGPRVQRALPLPPTHVTPPEGVKCLDPYSWDVYCLGRTMEALMELNFTERTPWTARWYVQWLIGDERGCTGVCHCRPTARKALRVLRVLILAVKVWDFFGSLLGNNIKAWRVSDSWLHCP